MNVVYVGSMVLIMVGLTSAFKIARQGIKSGPRLLQRMRMCEVPALDASPPMKIALLVEPTPFGYVSGYKNRFEEMLKFMKKAGDEVEVLTCDKDPNAAKDFLGYPISTNRGFEWPMYPLITLTYDFAMQTRQIMKRLSPDVVHVSSPSAIIFPAIIWSKIYKTPLVMSYHTDLFVYAQTYIPDFVPRSWGRSLAYFLIKNLHGAADLTLCTSPQLKNEISEIIGEKRVDIWLKGINAERFSPDYKSDAMRNLMSDGNPEAPLLVYIGRLGAEKRLNRLQKVLEANPGARLALVGTGPESHLKELREQYKDFPVKFTGMLQGDDLSAAFASADVFVMPSDSETLGFVVLESFASGVPVVGVAAGGVQDLIETGVTGHLVTNDDSDGMQQFSLEVKGLIEDKQRRIEYGQNARKFAELWSWETATSKLRNQQYKKAISNKVNYARDELYMNEEELAVVEKQGELFMPHMA